MTTRISKHILNFNFEAGTSRGILKNRATYYLLLEHNGMVGIGEASPLKGLSIDFIPDFEQHLQRIIAFFDKITAIPNGLDQITKILDTLALDPFPSIRFALETALLDLSNTGQKMVFSNSFVEGEAIPINGLIWMGDGEDMLKQADNKIKLGFDCIKMKVGAIQLEDEIRVLDYIRSKTLDTKIELRVDANGAFTKDNAIELMECYAQFDLHSIEQPVQPGQWDLMADLVQKNILPIALDEELIGVSKRTEKERLLDYIQPPYIILKPTLLGGLHHTAEWIELAESRNIKWWITSALESNIGLNAICQFTSSYNPSLPQGLGTGSLYTNNIDSPLTVSDGTISYDSDKPWGVIPGEVI